jgi:hypothetical protein
MNGAGWRPRRCPGQPLIGGTGVLESHEDQQDGPERAGKHDVFSVGESSHQRVPR